MHASLIRRQLIGLVPPKIATPSHLSGGAGGGSLTPLVNFYSKLPKGPASASYGGLKARYFSGKNASPAPLAATIAGLFLLGYTIDYQMHLKHHKNHTH